MTKIKLYYASLITLVLSAVGYIILYFICWNISAPVEVLDLYTIPFALLVFTSIIVSFFTSTPYCPKSECKIKKFKSIDDLNNAA